MRKKTGRFIGIMLAMVLAFLSIGEALPAFAADELILSDEIGEDILLTDAESPDEETADLSAAPVANCQGFVVPLLAFASCRITRFSLSFTV